MENIIYSPSGNVSIRINEDKMSAWMYIHRSDKIIDEREILNLIDDAGICNGFEDALQWMAENGYNKDFDKPFPVAICKSSVQNETLSYNFETAKTYNPEKEWNFRDVQTWPIVESGTVLATVSFNLFNDGASVYNIFGELATNLTGSLSLTDYLGINVNLDTDNKQIVAAVAGYPYIDSDNKINVADNLVYKGDVKLTKIPLNLSASLTIEGSINKAHLSVLKDLKVKGNVISAEIYTDGNLVIEGDIIDCQTTGIVSMGDIQCNSISDSLVVCRGHVSFDTFIKGSRVIGEKQVTGNPEISQICGSQVFSSFNVDVAEIGDNENNETEVEITVSAYGKERINQLKKTIAKLEENFDINSDRIEQANKKLKTFEQSLSEEIKNFFLSETDKPNTIKARNLVHKGAYLRVLSKAVKFKSNQSDVELSSI